MRKVLIILLKCAVSLLLYLAMLLLYIWPVRGHYEIPGRSRRTSTAPVISNREIQWVMKKYPVFRGPWMGSIQDITYTIPGLQATRTLKADPVADEWLMWTLAELLEFPGDEEEAGEEAPDSRDIIEVIREFLEEAAENQEAAENGDYEGLRKSQAARKVVTCTSMTPQGVCVAEDYLLVSAYCHAKRHDSVLYVIDLDTHELVKVVALQGRGHVGAIAYDPDFGNVWVASYDERGQRAYVNSLSLESIRRYDLETVQQALPYTQFYPIVTQKSASFMTYSDHALYVGYFTNRRGGESTIQKFDMNDSGGLVTYENADDRTLSLFRSVPMPSEMIDVGSICQGMTFMDDYVLISQSFGVVTSHLRGYVNTVEDGYLDARNRNAVFDLKLPPMLEQITSDGEGRLYMVFESASYAYRLWPSRHMDRVVVLAAGTAENLFSPGDGAA